MAELPLNTLLALHARSKTPLSRTRKCFSNFAASCLNAAPIFRMLSSYNTMKQKSLSWKNTNGYWKWNRSIQVFTIMKILCNETHTENICKISWHARISDMEKDNLNPSRISEAHLEESNRIVLVTRTITPPFCINSHLFDPFLNDTAPIVHPFKCIYVVYWTRKHERIFWWRHNFLLLWLGCQPPAEIDAPTWTPLKTVLEICTSALCPNHIVSPD